MANRARDSKLKDQWTCVKCLEQYNQAVKGLGPPRLHLTKPEARNHSLALYLLFNLHIILIRDTASNSHINNIHLKDQTCKSMSLLQKILSSIHQEPLSVLLLLLLYQMARLAPQEVPQHGTYYILLLPSPCPVQQPLIRITSMSLRLCLAGLGLMQSSSRLAPAAGGQDFWKRFSMVAHEAELEKSGKGNGDGKECVLT